MRRANISAGKKVAIFCFAALLAACGGGGSSSSTGAVTPPAPEKLLRVVASSVPEGSLAVDPRIVIGIALSATFGPGGVGSEQVQLTDGTRTYPLKIDINHGTLTITPIGGLHTRTDYRLIIKAGTVGADGSVLKNDYVLKFRTLIAVYETKQLTPVDLSVDGNNAPRIVATDINGDGRRDLVELGGFYRPDLFLAHGYTINIHLQNAAGGFERLQKLEYVAGEGGGTMDFNNLLVFDIDGDDKAEMMVPEFRTADPAVTGIRVFKAGADGQFAPYAFIATNYTQTLDAFDVDGDGRLDLVGSNRRSVDDNNGGFQVLLRTTTGFTHLAPIMLAGGNLEFVVADVDHDGKRELIVNRLFPKANNAWPTNELLFFSQGAPGVFSLNTALSDEAVGFCTNADYCQDMKTSDLNGDGKPELFFGARVVGNSDNLILGFSRQGGTRLTKNFHVSIGDSTSIFGIQDMDGDGVPDLLVVASTGFYSIIGGGPNFTFEFSNRITTPTVNQLYPPNVAIADIDGDGRPEIIFDNASSGIVQARFVKF